MAEPTADAQALSEAATNFDRISSDLKGAIGQVDSTAGERPQETEQGVTGMFASAGHVGAYGKDGAKGGNVEFEWKVEEGESSGDVFDFKAMEAMAEADTNFDAQGRLLIGTEGGIWSGGGEDLLIGGRTTFDFDGDGKDDLGTYQPDTDGGFVYLYCTATTPNSGFDGGSLATIDVGGIPVTMAEYGLMLA